MQILATNNFYTYDVTPILSPEEQNELDALDIIIGLSREERSYLLSVWRSCPTTPKQVRTEFRRTINLMRYRSEKGRSGATY